MMPSLDRLHSRQSPTFRLRPLAARLAGMPWRLTSEPWSTWVALAALLSAGLGLVQADTTLPVNPTTEVGAAITYTSSAGAGVITQTEAANIVRWDSFNLGKDATLTINQPSVNSVLLNKIESSLGQTTINGILNANGRVYIYNPDGIVFGKNSFVNVNTLIASTLQFDETRVIGGLITPGTSPVLAKSVTSPGSILVQGDGVDFARLISRDSGGQIILAAPQVTNNGQITSNDGQVILAAGQKVFLAAPQGAQQSTLRGLLVEVSNDASLADPSTVSQAENAATGVISVGRGNATMVGYAVNQKGVVSATTSVNLNGSIYLSARDQAVLNNVGTPVATRGGQLVLGESSVTQVSPVSTASLLDISDKLGSDTEQKALLTTQFQAQLTETMTLENRASFKKSEIALNAANIQLLGDGSTGATISASGGNVSIVAAKFVENTLLGSILDPNLDLFRVDVGVGVKIDVAGSTDAKLKMESNVIQADLRGAELSDNTVMRDSSLYGSKVNIDIRKNYEVANLDGWKNQVALTLSQLNTSGGSVSLAADGAIIQRADSVIKVDGGWVDYLAGNVNTSKFKLNDKLIDIGAAKPNTVYSGIVNLPNDPSTFELGYREGSSAGTVTMAAPILVMQGALSGKASAGERQRDPTAGSAPLGGRLQIGNVNGASINPSTGRADILLGMDFDASTTYSYQGKIQFGGQETATASAPEVGAVFDLSDTSHKLLSSQLDLDTGVLATQGFNRISALTHGNIAVNAPIVLAAGGQLWMGAAADKSGAYTSTLAGGNIQFNAGITIPSGSVAATASGGITVAPALKFDVAGRWTNDRALANPSLGSDGQPNSAILNKGGSFKLWGTQVTLGDGVAIDASAGAWNKRDTSIVTGAAGSIGLEAAFVEVPDGLSPEDTRLSLGKNLSLSAYGFSNGGQLKLVGRTIWLGSAASITDGAADPDVILDTGFFRSGGFSNYDLGSNLNLTLAANTVLTPSAQSWMLGSNVGTLSNGVMSRVASKAFLPLADPLASRPATSLTLRALPARLDEGGRLLLETGSAIKLDSLGTLSLFAGRQLTVGGELSAPGGQINLGLSTSPTDPFRAERSIWLTPTAQLSVKGDDSRLYTSLSGISSGELLNGGSIRMGRASGNALVSDLYGLAPTPGFVVVQAGATLNAGGAGSRDVSFKVNGTATPSQKIAGSGGSIEIRAREGLLFDGSLSAAAGGAGASGGSLVLALDNLGAGGPGSPGNTAIFNVSNDLAKSGSVNKEMVAGAAVVTEIIDEDTFESYGWWLTGTNEKKGWAAGSAWISPTAFSSGGFSRLTLKSESVLNFGLLKSGVSISARDSVVLDAPNIRATIDPKQPDQMRVVQISAPYVQLGSSDDRYQTPDASYDGMSKLAVNAGTIDWIGNSSLQGFGYARLKATEDIRFSGLATTTEAGDSFVSTGRMAGFLDMKGNLGIDAARVYPTTLSDFTLSVANGSLVLGQINFSSNGKSLGAPLSAGGSLNIFSPSIVQGGQIYAPFGNLTLGNLDSAVSSIITTSVTYSRGSITSVKGEGAIPLGSIVNGSVPTATQWSYGLSDGSSVSIVANPISGLESPQRQLPFKSITSNASSVKVVEGASLDLSGGGSMFAYEFTPGKGGSQDILSNSLINPDRARKDPVYAINANYRNGVAPVDTDYSAGSPLAPGRSIYLSGMPGLAAGSYTLLPAHYALSQENGKAQEGWYAVTLAPNSRDMQASRNTVLPDGANLVAGRLLNGGSGTGDTRNSGFYVMSRSVIDKKSEFFIKDATDFFTAQANGGEIPPLPTDGGSVAFQIKEGSASAELILAGSVNLAAASGVTGARRGDLAISAPTIEVVGAVPDVTAFGVVSLDSEKLKSIGAGSILLGGLKNRVNGKTNLTVGASTVTVKNDADYALEGAEVMLVASESLDIQAGSVINATGTTGYQARDIQIDGNSAFVRVSGDTGVELTRTSAAGAGEIGKIKLAVNSVLNAGDTGSLMVDSPGSMTVAESAVLNAGSSLWLGAPSIALDTSDSEVSSSSASLVLRSSRVDSLNQLTDLKLVSRIAAIDFLGDMTLGHSAMDLSLTAPGINSADTGDVKIRANNLKLAGTSAWDDTLPDLSTSINGSLDITVSKLILGDNVFGLTNFTTYEATSRDSIVAAGKQGALLVDGDIELKAKRLVTETNAAAVIASANDLNLSVYSRVSTESLGFGGQWRLIAANDLTSALNILAPSGKVSLEAGNALSVTEGTLSTVGAAVDFNGTLAYGPAGTVNLTGATINLANSATIDVSSVGAAAGLLNMQALASDGSGSYQIDATIKGTGLGTQGQFALDTDAVVSSTFSALNTALNSGGFTESRQIRARTGDINVDSTITAKDVTLAADDGNITVSGTIDARASKGGSIALYASQQDATGSNGRIDISGSLLANATSASTLNAGGSIGNGGFVLLSSSNADGSELIDFSRSSASGATINLQASSVIDVSGLDAFGASVVRNGSVVLRAPRVTNNDDLGIFAMSGTITNSAATQLEGVRVYSAETISELDDDTGINLNATSTGAMYTEAASFGQSATQILSTLGASLANNVTINPGIEVRSEGDLIVSVNEFATNAVDRGWDLSGWRFGSTAADPANITLRAAGNLTITGSISDGFVKPTSTALSMPNWALGTDRSASLRLVGGADLLAANTMTVFKASELSDSGDVIIDFAARTTTSDAPVSKTDMPVSVVRTGTGRIDVAAARDMTLAMAPLFKLSSDDLTLDSTPEVYDEDIYSGYGGYKVTLMGASLYTAGKNSGSLVTDPSNWMNTHFGASSSTKSSAAFADSGGAIRIAANRNVNGPRVGDVNDATSAPEWFYRKLGIPGTEDDPDTNDIDETEAAQPGEKIYLQQALPNLVNSWFFRQGRTQVDSTGLSLVETTTDGSVLNTAWWARPEYFNQGIATFAGGDIAIKAGSNVNDLSVSSASNARVSGSTLVEQGGGDIRVAAGADIRGGALFVQKGSGLLQAGAAITTGNLVSELGNASTALNPVIAIGDAKISVVAGNQAAVENVYNPTMTPQALKNFSTGASQVESSFQGSTFASDLYWDTSSPFASYASYRNTFAQYSNFITYTADSALNIQAVSGSVVLKNDALNLVTSARPNDVFYNVERDFDKFYSFAPASLSMQSLSGKVSALNGFVMMPAATGQLSLLAKDSIVLLNGTARSLRMLDNDPTSLSNTAAPRILTEADLDLFTGRTISGLAAHTKGGLHAADTQRTQVMALSGDILGDPLNSTSLDSPKATQIFAGRDIRDFGVRIQHNNADDISEFTAGRDYFHSTQSDNLSDVLKVSAAVTGPGRVDITAGRNIDFANSLGFVTRGGLDNPYLGAVGAGVNVATGISTSISSATRYAQFVSHVTGEWGGAQYEVEKANEASLLRSFVSEKTGSDYSSSSDAIVLSAYKKLAAADRLEFATKFGSMADIALDSTDTVVYSLFQSFVAEKSSLKAAAIATDASNSAAVKSQAVLKAKSLAADTAKPSDVWAAFMSLDATTRADYLADHPSVATLMGQRAARLETLLAADEQQAMNASFFALLRTTGKDLSLQPLPQDLSQPFDLVVASLFPEQSIYGGGSIATFASQIKTEQGGDVDLLAPFGSVYAGLTQGVAAAKAANQGIFTIRGGDLRAMVNQDFLVNQGRVFTVGGGDITLVSQTRNIDAGKGAKTASSAPPPIIKISPDGNVSVDVSSSISGSGIATLRTRDDQASSSVYVLAPRGEINAGDAGIKSENDLDIVAPIIKNADNIAAAGKISGVVTAPAAPAAPPAPPAAAATSTTNAAARGDNPLTPKPERVLSVELLGYGDDSGDGDGNSDDSKNPRKQKKN